ncbi:agmatine deiminase family protein [Pedobacter nutrimenti]|uniref:Agmatine deiminase n=1 Tax=Pedobacter nutrimenti TaxID=1241337 RepID=A0A318UC34_9SPHI|nr:agmatine deiminase family protein [Pedobacter nutrimenti]PYF72990.1 agmatine deiminase [Pedobacter nutrimenti]
MKKILYLMVVFPLMVFAQKNQSQLSKTNGILYTMPEESEPHEGTWLQWPHEYQYGETYSNRLDETWIAMTEALVRSEKVHIIAYDEDEKEKIEEMLHEANVSLANVDFYIFPTDDFWVRDNGPIYVRDRAGKLLIEDWGFNGWGKKAAFTNCNAIPSKISSAQGKTRVDLNSVMINEGGAVEIDGNGTLLTTKSAVLNSNRNPGMSQAQAEAIFRKYLGVTHFIWLNGKAGLEITDMHIDGFARFGNSSTLVTMSEDDLADWQVPDDDIDKLYQAKNKSGKPYRIVKLPLTKNAVTTAYGKELGYKGSYVNYYIANKVVLVPNYHDVNDAVANAIIQKLYPTKEVVGIDVRNLYANGGMIHCVTQQQPKQ